MVLGSAGQRADPTVRDRDARHDAVGVGSKRGSSESTGSGVSPTRPGLCWGSGFPRVSAMAFCTLMLTVEPTHFLGSVGGGTPPGPVDGTTSGSCAAIASTAQPGGPTRRSRVNSSRFQQL